MKTSESKPAGSVKKTPGSARTAKSTKAVSAKAVGIKTPGARAATAKTATPKTVRSKKVIASATEPTEEAVSRKAYEIYTDRMLRGERGTAHDDWQKALEILRK